MMLHSNEHLMFVAGPISFFFTRINVLSLSSLLFLWYVKV